jgi:hypothetical protein
MKCEHNMKKLDGKLSLFRQINVHASRRERNKCNPRLNVPVFAYRPEFNACDRVACAKHAVLRPFANAHGALLLRKCWSVGLSVVWDTVARWKNGEFYVESV